ncbi:DUF551 domain-containing protein [Escherichia coli]|nr:DUF551 domain-containing protein [Escherichia coli]
MRFARLASKSASRGIRDMAELTKEWLKQTIAEYEANRDELPFGLDTNSAIELQAFKLALASLEAEPVAYIFKHPAGKLFWALTDESNKEQSDVIPVYAAPPVPVVPEEKPMPNPLKMYAVDAVAAIAEVRGWNACRAAMLQAEPVSNSDELPLDYLQGHKDGLEWAAQLAEANHPQTGDWLYDDPIDLARAIRKGPDMPTVQAGNYPVTPDGWISCSERMPNTKTAVLVAVEFDRKGDWRMKWATYIPGHPDANDGWIIPGASWKPSHWMPLPAAPQQEADNG